MNLRYPLRIPVKEGERRVFCVTVRELRNKAGLMLMRCLLRLSIARLKRRILI